MIAENKSSKIKFDLMINEALLPHGARHPKAKELDLMATLSQGTLSKETSHKWSYSQAREDEEETMLHSVFIHNHGLITREPWPFFYRPFR